MIRGKLWNEPRIFISYRRDDSGGYVGRLYNDLIKHFHKKNIFMDIDTIEGGDEFTRAIETTVNSCDVLIAVIGRDWSTIRDKENGVRRLDDPHDFVRYEIANALKRNIIVIPVLVQGVIMPRPVDLPDELKSLTVRQAIEISDTRWDYDLKKLIGRLKKVKAAGGARLPLWQKISLALTGAAILSLGVWGLSRLLFRPSQINTNGATNSKEDHPDNYSDDTARFNVGIVSQLFPSTPRDKVEKHLPLVLNALREKSLADKEMVLLALAAIRADRDTLEPISDIQSEENTTPGGHPFDKYDNREGNNGPPDGERFKGRGFIGLFGRRNYQNYGQAVGLGNELIYTPDKANDPEVASKLLAAFLKDREKALREALRQNKPAEACKVVFGGYYHLEKFIDTFQTGYGLISRAA